jgi:hypothetical protein
VPSRHSRLGIPPGMPAPPPSQADAAGAREGEEERYGPLVLTRIVKEDGRSLIRFDRADQHERA